MDDDVHDNPEGEFDDIFHAAVIGRALPDLLARLPDAGRRGA